MDAQSNSLRFRGNVRLQKILAVRGQQTENIIDNGYGHQPEEAMNRIRTGDLKSSRMSLTEIVALIELIEQFFDKGEVTP